MSELQLVQRDSPTTVVFDFDDVTGAANPNTVTTILRELDMGSIDRPMTLVKQVGAPLANRAIGDPQPRLVVPLINAKGSSMATLQAGIDELYRVLMSDAVVEHLLAWDNGAGVRFLEPLGVEGAAPNLRGGDTLQMQVAANGRDISLAIPIRCQPYLVSTELDGDTNVVTNATLGVKGTGGTNIVDGWAWASLTGITGEQMDALNGAYSFVMATTGPNNFQQTSPVGTAVAGTTYADSFYVKAASAGVVRAQAVIRFADAAGAVLGSETVGTLTAIGTTWTRLSVSAVAPASTSRILVTLRFQNVNTTSTQVWIRDAQAEAGSSASTFRVGKTVVQADASKPYGLTLPLVVSGSAPTPVTFDIECAANSKLTSMRMGAKWNRGTTGTFRLLDYLNDTHYVQAGASADGWTVTVENLGASGGVVSDAEAYNSSGIDISVPDATIGVRLRRWRAVRTTQLDSLRGEWLVLGRFDPRQSDVTWQLQMQYASANVDPVPNAEAPVTLEVERTGDTGQDASTTASLTTFTYKPLGVMRIPESGNIGAVRIELWVARRNDYSIGSSQLRFGGLLLMPYSPRTLIQVPGTSKVVWNDTDFATGAANVAAGTGVYKLATDPGGATWDSGERLGGGGIRLDQPNEAMGVRPTAGQAWGSGRARVSFDVQRVDPGGLPTNFYVRVIRVGAAGGGGSGADAVMVQQRVSKAKVWAVEFTATAGETYVPQAYHNGKADRRFSISEITKRFVPYLVSGERMVADAEQLQVTKRDSSSNIQGELDVQGQTPFVLEPGRYVITVVPGEVKQAGHEDDDAPLARSWTVHTRHSPRWTQ